MINLYDNRSDALIGSITEEQLQFLKDSMEEESTTDQDYFIDEPTLEYFDALGVDPGLLSLLRAALGDRKEATIRWEKA